MIQTISLFIVTLILLFILSTLMGLYVRRYERIDLIIAIYVTFILTAQLLATKLVIFDVGLTAPAGILLFPFTYQMTDIINEKFGQKETHRAILIAFLTQLIMVSFFVVVVSLPGFVASSEASNALEIWNGIFGFTLGITLASWIAFLISENLDAILFQVFKRITGGDKKLWLRSMGSDVISVTIDSIIFIPFAFFIFPTILNQSVTPTNIIIDLIIGQIGLKAALGLLDTPFLYLTRWLMYGELDTKFPVLEKFAPIH